jgi:hypothetical protein
MRVVNKHFVKSIENTIKNMVYPDDVKEISYIVTVFDKEWEGIVVRKKQNSLNNACKYLQHYIDEQIGEIYVLQVYVYWKDGVTDDDEVALNPEEVLSVKCKKQSNGRYWVSQNYFIDGWEVNKEEYL